MLTEVQKGSVPKLTGKSPSGKANRLLCTNSTKKVAKGDLDVVIGMFPNVQNSKLPVDADSETSVHTNSLQNLLWKRTIQHRSRVAFHRMMNDRCNYGKVSWMTRDPITREPTLGVVQTGSQNQRNSNAPTFEGRSIEWTLRMAEMARKSVWTLHTNVYEIPGSYSENRQRFFKPSPASNVSSPHMKNFERERDLIRDSGASLQIMNQSDLTPEEQETVRKSKDPSVIMTANGTTHTTEKSNSICL